MNKSYMSLLLGTVVFVGMNVTEAKDKKVVVASSSELEGAKSFVQDLGDQAISIINKQGISDQQVKKEFTAVLDKKFAMVRIARYAMGASYKLLTEEEKQVFLKWFKNKQIKEYLSQFKEYKKAKLIVKSAVIKGSQSGQVLVNSVVKVPGKKDIDLSWSVYPNNDKNSKDKFKIYDVVSNNISISKVQRSECQGIISKKGGLKKFVKYLKEEENR